MRRALWRRCRAQLRRRSSGIWARVYMQFQEVEGARGEQGQGAGWALAFMEMLTDPMLRQWVPAWVVEQYERANPFSESR